MSTKFALSANVGNARPCLYSMGAPKTQGTGAMPRQTHDVQNKRQDPVASETHPTMPAASSARSWLQTLGDGLYGFFSCCATREKIFIDVGNDIQLRYADPAPGGNPSASRHDENGNRGSSPGRKTPEVDANDASRSLVPLIHALALVRGHKQDERLQVTENIFEPREARVSGSTRSLGYKEDIFEPRPEQQLDEVDTSSEIPDELRYTSSSDVSSDEIDELNPDPRNGASPARLQQTFAGRKPVSVRALPTIVEDPEAEAIGTVEWSQPPVSRGQKAEADATRAGQGPRWR